MRKVLHGSWTSPWRLLIKYFLLSLIHSYKVQSWGLSASNKDPTHIEKWNDRWKIGKEIKVSRRARGKLPITTICFVCSASEQLRWQKCSSRLPSQPHCSAGSSSTCSSKASKHQIPDQQNKKKCWGDEYKIILSQRYRGKMHNSAGLCNSNSAKKIQQQ